MAPAPVIRLHPDDGVLIARSSLPAGLVVADGVTTVERIPAGHKVAIKPIATGVSGIGCSVSDPSSRPWPRDSLSEDSCRVSPSPMASVLPAASSMFFNPLRCSRR